MKNENNNIDQLFKRSFKGFQNEPPANIKANIIQTLDKKDAQKKKSKGFWFLPLVLCLVSVPMFIVLFSTGKANENNPIFISNNIPKSNFQLNNNSSLTHQLPSQTANSNGLKTNNLNNTIYESNHQNNLCKNHNQLTVFKPLIDDQKTTNKNFGTKNNTKGNALIISNKTSDEEKPVVIQNKFNPQPAEKETVILSSFKENKPNLTNNKITSNTNDNNNSISVQPATRGEIKEPIYLPDADKTNEKPTIFPEQTSLNKPSSPPGPPSQSKFSFDVFATPLIALARGQNQNYGTFVTLSQKSNLSPNLGVEAKYAMSSKLFLQSGINYTAFNSKINYDINAPTSIDTSESHWTVDYHTFIDHIDSTLINDSTGGSFYIYDTIYATTIDSAWLQIADTTFLKEKGANVNTVSYIEFPLLVGFTFRKGNLSFQISTGISYGILSGNRWKPSKIVSSPIGIYFTSESWKKNIYNYLLRIGCSYYINDRLSLFLQPSLRININALFDKSFVETKKYNAIGFNTGVNFKL